MQSQSNGLAFAMEIVEFHELRTHQKLERFKGQLISKCLFDAIVSTKKPTKFF